MTFDPNKLPENDKEWAEFYKDTAENAEKKLHYERAVHEGYRQGVQMVVNLIISHLKRGG